MGGCVTIPLLRIVSAILVVDGRSSARRACILNEFQVRPLYRRSRGFEVPGGISGAVKSARAPRRLENVRNRRAMFYLDGRDGTAAAKHGSSSPNGEEIFGWWLSDDREIAVSSRSYHVRNHRSPGSSASMLSSIDSDDSGSCSFVRDVSRQEQESGICEKIELISFTRRDDLDVDLIERDAGETSSSPATVTGSERNVEEESINRINPVCYTPERLIRSQEYRILVPSPRRFTFSQVRFTLENAESRDWKYRRCRKRSSRLVDSRQIGATQSEALLSVPSTDLRTYASSSPISDRRHWITDNFNVPVKSNDDPSTDGDYGVQSTKTSDSSRSSYNRFNSTWDDCKGPATRSPSLEDTSGIQSYDWSLETQSDAQNTMCLCDELAIASKDHAANFANNRGAGAINEVASILEGLRNDPGKATALLEEEDRFCYGTSSHDQLTRLALAIETDVEAPAVPDDPNNWIRHLRDRIERLQLANKEIHGDIRGLRTNFQRDEKKAINLLGDTTRLLEDVHDLRYFDDLVKLLKGELERISRRNWPFILGHSKPHKEMNLII